MQKHISIAKIRQISSNNSNRNLQNPTFKVAQLPPQNSALLHQTLSVWLKQEIQAHIIITSNLECCYYHFCICIFYHIYLT